MEHTPPPWSALPIDEKIVTVAILLAAGKDRDEIADELGIKSSALGGFAWRHQEIRALCGRRHRPNRHAFVPDERMVDPKAWLPLTGADPVLLLDNRGGCCWPVEGGQCGLPRHRKSYCQTHFSMAYRGSPQVDAATVDWLASIDERGPKRPADKYAVLPEKKPVLRSEDDE